MANAAAKGESMEIRDERIKNAVDSGRFVTPNIAKGSDGVYRWMYELNLFKNPTVLITVYKVLLITFAIMLVFFFFISIPGGNFAEQFIGMLKVLVILFGIFLVLGLISYLIYAAYLGGKYIVLFEMNEHGVTHTQMPRQYNRVRRVAGTAIISAFLNNDLTLLANINLSTMRDSSTSVFSHVKSIKPRRSRNVIYVNSPFVKNQIYAEDMDFVFVEWYIKQHCRHVDIR